MHRFLCDCMLGTLARRMRMAGIDTAYWRNADTAALIAKADAENRVVLTRATAVAKRNDPSRVYCVSASDVPFQFTEVLRFFNISPESCRLLSRCLGCNSELVKIQKELVSGLVPEYVFHTIDDFSICQKCNKIFWKGTHYKNMIRFLNLQHEK